MNFDELIEYLREQCLNNELLEPLDPSNDSLRPPNSKNEAEDTPNKEKNVKKEGSEPLGRSSR